MRLRGFGDIPENAAVRGHGDRAQFATGLDQGPARSRALASGLARKMFSMLSMLTVAMRRYVPVGQPVSHEEAP